MMGQLLFDDCAVERMGRNKANDKPAAVSALNVRIALIVHPADVRFAPCPQHSSSDQSLANLGAKRFCLIFEKMGCFEDLDEYRLVLPAEMHNEVSHLFGMVDNSALCTFHAQNVRVGIV
jgi:hypothetical protein